MRELNRFSLDFDRTFKYIKYVLEDANELSIAILNCLDAYSGNFYTWLPREASLERIYDFSSGGILPEGIHQEITVLGKKYQAEIINNLQEELSDIVFSKISEKANVACIIDDVLRCKESKGLKELSCSSVLQFLKGEVYYLLDYKSANKKTISKCIQNSNAIWHSLCVLYDSNNINIINKNLSSEVFKKIATNTITFIVGAYDGEGYIFWDKN